MMKPYVFGLRLAAAFVSIGLLAQAAPPGPRHASAPAPAPSAGAEDPVHPRLPGFSRPTLDGKIFDSAAQQNGRPLLIVYWAAWCNPCRQEAPLLRKLKSDYGERLLMVGIAAGDGEGVDEARLAAKKWQLNYPVIFDQDESLRMIFNVQMIPQLILIGPDGRLVIRTGDLHILEQQLNLLIVPFTRAPT
jgi:thiol-disulfide isomerase/thioredoxin